MVNVEAYIFDVLLLSSYIFYILTCRGGQFYLSCYSFLCLIFSPESCYPYRKQILSTLAFAKFVENVFLKYNHELQCRIQIRSSFRDAFLKVYSS